MPKRRSAAQLEAARARLAEVAATEFMSLWGEPAKLPADALPGLPGAPKPRTKKPKIVGNPCVARFGVGPDGATCKGCAHLYRMHWHDYKYPKCDLRKLTHGPGSDHRVNWLACGKYEAREA
jgi:hypothetical protein